MKLSILIPFILIFSLPILFMILPIIFKNIMPGANFKISSILTIVLWCLISIFMLKFTNDFSVWDWFSGMLLISAVVIFAFMLWSVFCWGYTISMLVCLQDQNEATINQWENLYTGSKGIEELTHNRAQVLVWLGFAFINNNALVLTSLGKFAAKFFSVVCRFMGIQTASVKNG